MKIQHIPASQNKTTNWSGGTTSELFIYPPESDFQSRNFQFRISTATIEVEESVFTALADVNRTLMLLEGKLTLIHEGNYSKTLLPFEQDSFDGGWQTKSIGKATDFNLMCKGETKGELSHLKLDPKKEQNLLVSGDMEIIYLASGSVNCGGKLLEKGDTLVLIPESAGNEISISGEADLVCVRIGN